MSLFGKEYAITYDFLYRDKDYQKEYDFIEAVFVKFSGNVKRGLDLGCGTGLLVFKAKEKFNEGCQ